ncbi:GAF domain-containing protein [Mitsuaria sp. GD03876]|uniref:GAF domain-containing protein n=1 Tax=Mitsuaria sp. GD03876 TaxID=2975399 RepID=UPI00244D6173|nr:GAF domain-containing protein [Mitsuaria sp. GD03876]MDH0867113.1 ATP-binding protein [Mitsuaria sp. GD03876]
MDPLHATAALDPIRGVMAARVRDFDWSRTPLGPMDRWPGALRAVVATMLECRLPMYLAWGDGYTQVFNDAYLPILGAKAESALGGRAPDTWAEIWPTIGPMWAQVLAGSPVGFDDFKLTIDRFGYPEDVYFNFSYSAVRDETGRAAGVLVTFAETTEKVLVSRRLAFLDDLAQGTRTLVDPADVMRFTAERLGRYLGANRCAYATVRADEDTFDLIGDFNDGVPSIVGTYRFADFGQAVLRLMRADQAYVNHDVDRDPVTANDDRGAYARTRIQSVICVPLHKDGRFVAAMAVHQSVARHWTDDEVALVKVVVARCWEALERTRAEAALREEARTLEILNRTGATLAAELDIGALVQRVTDAATQLTGARFGAFFYNGIDDQGEAYLLYSLSGAERQHFERLGHPRPTPLFGPTFRGEPTIRLDDVMADPRYGQWAPHHGKPAGHLPVRSYLAVPVISRSGEVLGGLFFGHEEVGVFTERSERLAEGIASQAAIAIDNARLYAASREAMAERTRLLESERTARLAAEQAGLVKDEFLATLSHELRTPLSAITGWVHILRRKLGDEPPELKRGIDVIERSARAQAQLIEDLLDMSRITTGKLSLEVAPVSAASFTLAAVELLAPAAERAGVRLSTEVTVEAGATVMGDAARLQQVVANLVSNAIKFTPRGGEVRVQLRGGEQRADLVVEDTGIGIAPDFLPFVFERFRQADGSMSRRHGGLGLGLSIVRNLVELHGGQVRAESAGEGRGARFVVTLPVIGVRDFAGASPEAGAADRTSLAGARILVVDDDEAVREMVARALALHGAEVLEAGSGAEALARLPDSGVNLLISDIGMPEMTGHELIARVRARSPAPGLRAIALTAFAGEADRQRALDAGFEAHFRKPVDFSALVRAIQDMGLSVSNPAPPDRRPDINPSKDPS